MTEQWANARIQWLLGPSVPPPTERYSATTHFNEDPSSDWWTILVEIGSPIANEPSRFQGRVRFISPEGPINRLRPGKTLDLYEGPRKVAEVEVIG